MLSFIINVGLLTVLIIMYVGLFVPAFALPRPVEVIFWGIGQCCLIQVVDTYGLSQASCRKDENLISFVVILLRIVPMYRLMAFTVFFARNTLP